MDRTGEEILVDDIAGNAERRGKGCDVTLKLEGRNMLAPPVICTSLTSDWAESSTNDLSDKGRTEENNSSRHIPSLPGSEPCHVLPWPKNDTGNIVKELTMGNYRNSHLALINGHENHKQGKWQHMYLSPSEFRCEASHGDYVLKDKDEILSRAGERLMKMSSDLWDLKHLSSKGIDYENKEINASGDKVLTSNNTPALKTLHTPSFSKPLVKRAKGKGVALKKQEDITEHGGSVTDYNNGNPVYSRNLVSSALVRSSTNRDQLILDSSHRSGTEYLHNGISLREWLKSERGRRDKVESLQIFRIVVELVDSAHSGGVVFQDLRPSCLKLLPSCKVVYTGSSTKRGSEAATPSDLLKKRPLGKGGDDHRRLGLKQPKLKEDIKLQRDYSHVTNPQDHGYAEFQSDNHCNSQLPCMTTTQAPLSLTVELEEKWYRSPEQLVGSGCTSSSNIYSLGILLFELLSSFESLEVHSAVMMDLHDRILLPTFLSEHPREAGFCLWLLHPDPSSRPTAREILQSALIGRRQTLQTGGNESQTADNDDTESGLLLHFLKSLELQKQRHAAKLAQAIECLEEDIKEVVRRHSLKNFNYARAQDLSPVTSSASSLKEISFLRNIKQIEEAYFFSRSQIQNSPSAVRSDKDLLKNQSRLRAVHNEKSNMNQGTFDPLGDFFDGLSKFVQYNRFEVCGSLRNGDIVSTTNVLCSLSCDRDEDYIAAAGVSKKIKVFEFDALLNDSRDIHYPVVEMSNKSKLSCVCWNNYIKNYLASADYDGVVQIWDVGTGQGFSQYIEHQKRAWSVDFSIADPLMFVSGSDDCSVKLWSINERSSLGTIWNPANVCCVQFSASSTYMLAFGSADYKVYCYDLRHTRVPWCTLAGHEKAVSYVKFLDSQTLVSASTDNTLKLWDLNKTSSTELSSSACKLTFRGHSNEKNFVGLSALDGYIACGSETNEVYCYYRSLPMPITSHKFRCIDPISGNETGDDNGQFVSSVCWRRKSNMVVAANSSGYIEALRMV